jgi:hypothetical protein
MRPSVFRRKIYHRQILGKHLQVFLHRGADVPCSDYDANDLSLSNPLPLVDLYENQGYRQMDV